MSLTARARRGARLRTWATVARHFHGTGRLLWLSVVLSIFEAVLLLPAALIVRNVFDRLIPARAVGAILTAGAEILGLYLASAAVGLLIEYVVLVVTKQAVAQLREALIERVLGFARSYFDRQSVGVLHAIIVQDSERLDVVASTVVAELVPAVVVSIGLAVVMLVLNAFLFAVLLAVVPLLLLIGKLLGRQVRGRYRAWQRSFDTFSAQILLALRAITLMKVSGAEYYVLGRRRRDVRELSRTGREMVWRQSSYRLVQGAVAAAAGVVVLVVGGGAVAAHAMTLGGLLAFYALVALLLRQLNVILSGVPQLVGAYESAARLAALLDGQEREPYQGDKPIVFKGGLTLERVSFGYREQLVLHEITLEVHPGERIAIIGPNGAGKSTLLSLMLGLYRPTSGRLLADGIPFDELDLRLLRRRIGVLLQEPLLFPASVFENVAYGRPDASHADVRRAAELATADQFITLLPDGYDTVIGDDGSLLSGGQRQRIALARALLGEPAMLILDEPTNHLDDRSIAALLENLRDYPGNPAIVTITHDLELARTADRVYRIRGGRLLRDDDLAPAAGAGVGAADADAAARR